jgi:3-oxoacyl-[acyl-carrier-protein] synthase III
MLQVSARPAIGIRGIGYYTGEQRPIDEIPQLAADPEALGAFEARGFKHYTRSDLSLADQAARASRGALRAAGLSPGDIDAVLIGSTELRWFDDVQERIAGDFLRALGFGNTFVAGVNLGGCTNYTTLLRMARGLIAGEGYRHVLVVESNKCLHDGSDRLVMPDLSVFSDGAAACVVTRDAPQFIVRGLAQVTTPVPPAYTIGPGATVAHRMASMRFVLERALREAGVTRADIRQFLLPNHGTHMLNHIVARMGIPGRRVHVSNLYWLAHAWSADTIINLHSFGYYHGFQPGDLMAIVSWSEFSFTSVVLESTVSALPQAKSAVAS